MTSRYNSRSLFDTGPCWAAALLCVAVLAWAGAAWAQLPVPASTQFDLTGFLQEATLENCASTDNSCGGTLKVNGHVVIVPKNTIVIYPANALTWKELFTKAPAPYGLSQTGMAMADSPAPLTTYEVQVVGNRLEPGGQYIAGLINISQQSLSAGAGFINFIDYAKGEMRVGGVLNDSTTGARVRINDPLGRYGRATTSPDVRFTVDPDNPTIMAGTGYPMCLPRTAPTSTGGTTDPLCPEENRPRDNAGNPIPQFTTNNLTNPNFPKVPGFPDSTKQAPFEVGDYVTYAGTLVADCPACPGGGTTVGPYPGAANTYISAHTITNNVAIYTHPGSDPAYIMIEVSLIGTGGLTVLGAGEAAFRTRFEGMTTDPTRRVHLYGIDFDQTGNTQDRDFGTIFPDPGPPNGAVQGRWRFRPPCLPFGSTPTKPDKDCVMNQVGTFMPAPREVRAVIEDPVTGVSANSGFATVTPTNQLIWGQYHAPIGEYIFPENIPGSPVVENNFNAIPFLACGGYSSSGIGSTLPGATTPVTLPFIAPGPLSPWPSNVAPDQAACIHSFNAPLVAVSASPNPAISGQLQPVTLTATVTGGTPPITFQWDQAPTDVRQVVIANPTTATATFQAPTVTASTQLHFTVTACSTVDGTRTCNSAPVTVTVNPGAAPDQVTVTSAEYRTGQKRLSITVTESVVSPTLVLTLQPYRCETNAPPCDANGFYNPAVLGNTFTNTGGGLYTLTLVGAPAPACKLGGPYATPCTQAPIKVQSSTGGVGTSALTRIRQ